jgi:hypothetical protein
VIVKTESTAFTVADVPHFFDEILMVDVRHTIERLRADSARLQRLADAIPDERGATDEWNAKEVLAHIAVLSRAYGVFAYMVAKGRIDELAIGDVISQRDIVGEEMARKPVREIVDEAVRQHRRTLGFLESATLEEMKRTVKTETAALSVEHLIRLPLIAHLEQHLDQLEAALAAKPAAAGGAG